LADAQRAFRSLEGAIASLEFEPDNQESVNAAVKMMEEAIDVKTRSYRGNALVESVAKGLKEQYRTAILVRAAKARSESNSGRV
jgi:hypothetical protein